MNRYLIRLMLLPVCAAIGAGVALATPGTAVAGTEGQQIYIQGYDQYYVRICGMNQNFQNVCDYIATPNYSTPVPGWWWIGAQKTTAGTLYTAVNISNYGPYHNFLGVTKCYPPESQASNWYPCPGL